MARVTGAAKQRKREYDKRRYDENREAIIDKARTWYEANKSRKHQTDRDRRNGDQRETILEEKRDYSRRTYPSLAKAFANRHLLRRYGITLDEKMDLLVDQGGLCAICGREIILLDPREWHLDHDHASGRIRGILCFTCNVGIGQLKDDPVRLLDSVAYLSEGEVSSVDPEIRGAGKCQKSPPRGIDRIPNVVVECGT